MAIVIDEYTFYGIIFTLVFLAKVIQTQGGLRIVLWRVWGKKGLLHVRKMPDGTARRALVPWKKVLGTLPHYELDGVDWYVGGPRESIRVFGFPQYVYVSNDARPLPLEHVQTKAVEIEREVEVNEKGKIKKIVKKVWEIVVIAGKPIDPLIIHAGLVNDVVAKFNSLKQPQAGKLKWGLFGVAIVLILLFSAVGVFYAYYFGINANCAVHSRICP